MARLFFLLALCPVVLAATDFSQSCSNYYVGNGISDGSGELFVEAWCHGGQDGDEIPRPDQCTRLKLAGCFKYDDGEIRGFRNNEEPADELLDSCDIATCAMRGDAWDGVEMSCYCRGQSGAWGLASVNLDEYIGNVGGYLECGSGKARRVASTDCLDPWASKPSESELR